MLEGLGLGLEADGAREDWEQWELHGRPGLRGSGGATGSAGPQGSFLVNDPPPTQAGPDVRREGFAVYPRKMPQTYHIEPVSSLSTDFLKSSEHLRIEVSFPSISIQEGALASRHLLIAPLLESKAHREAISAPFRSSD